MPQQMLTTDRLVLEPLADEHLMHEVELDADAEVLRYLGGRGRTRSEVEASHTSRLAFADPVDGLGVWAGFVDRGFVGLWMLLPPHGPDQVFVEGEADLGYRVARAWWRQGLAREGCLALMAHGFGELGLTRVFAQTATENEPSRALLSKLGLTFVRHVGEGDSEVEYELRAGDWLSAGAPGRTDRRGR